MTAGAVRPSADGAVAARGGARLLGVAYRLVLAGCTVVALAWLGVGAWVAVARYVPAAAGGTGAWARAVAAAAPASEPPDQLLVDYLLSLVALAIAVLLLVRGGRGWSIRLMALAMVGASGAFNLQAHAAATAVASATGISAGPIHQIVLHGLACSAYILALLVFPTADSRWIRAGGAGRVLLAVLVLALVGVVAFGTALLQHTTSCVLFFGLLVPLVGLGVLPARIRTEATAADRTRARMVFSLLVASFAATLVLGTVTAVLWSLGVPGLTLVDPTAHGGTQLPVALLFWASRLGSAAIAVAVLVAAGAQRLWAAERVFSRLLAAVLTVAVVGGGAVVLEAFAWSAGFSAAAATLGAAVPAALAFLPVHRVVEGLTDRLLYGRRPTPYSALAEVAALARAAGSGAPDLASVAEAVGRALGASLCRLTVVRPGLRDRVYAWGSGPTGPGAGADGGELVAVPVLSGGQRFGTLEVDRAAVAGLHADRGHLLEDIADSLGVVVAAARLGVELERQLRAALAHAAEIAVSRREAVSEMDHERRRIERDLHDGAQHHLVALRLVLGLVEHEVENGRVEQARERLGVLAGQLDAAEAVLAETAGGVRSIALAERGLVAALQAELEGPPRVPVESTLAPGRRFPLEIEAAVYFCCLESVNNAHKHAPGADVVVRFGEADGRLHFAVQDHGPGFVMPEPAGVGPTAATAGRGLRNLAARIAAAGGRVDLRSAPGEGTTVEGTVPVPPATPPIAPAPAAGSGPVVAAGAVPLVPPEQPGSAAAPAPGPSPAEVPAPRPPTERDGPLVARVRAVVEEVVRASPSGAALREVTALLDRPLRVAVDGPAGSGVSTLVAALAAGLPDTVEILERPAADRPADARLLLLTDGPPSGEGPAWPPALGVLARADLLDADPWQEAARRAADPAVRGHCHTVVPVSAVMARGARGGIGPDTERIAQVTAELAADGAVPEEIAAELDRRSGVPLLRETLRRELLGTLDARRARSAVEALEAVVAGLPAGGDERLRYHVERLRSEAHELAELDLLDRIRAGSPALTADHRADAEQLLGAGGAGPRERLGLPPDAGPEEIRLAAGARLVWWQRRAAHPVAGRDERAAAAVLVSTCERLLTAVPSAVPTAPG
ncbi:ATP-binding protein [Pseudonocardia xishanensis]|uniref:histidine kinase n=1 Tax=Pseudonocardia xishanensis TaxID=630995 RepID=A0ABP8RW48_9PSEU